MKNVLNITNGGCAVEVMEKANISGAFLSSDDVLHDGAVPDSLALEKLSEVRNNWGQIQIKLLLRKNI